MGIHWAAEGSVAHRLHPLTKQRMFEGPGLHTAQEVGDAAYGGQVLLSHDAWVLLRSNMAAAGFPVIRCLGLFHMEVSTHCLHVFKSHTVIQEGSATSIARYGNKLGMS